MQSAQVFISYRRDGGAELARLIRKDLIDRGFAVFMDVEDLGRGHFDRALYERIEAASDFVMVLTPGSLEGCRNEQDWFRLELSHAIEAGTGVVPVRASDFEWPSQGQLPEAFRDLRNLQQVSVSHEFFDASMDKLESMLSAAPAAAKTPIRKCVLMMLLCVAGAAGVGLLKWSGGLEKSSESVPSTSGFHAPSPPKATAQETNTSPQVKKGSSTRPLNSDAAKRAVRQGGGEDHGESEEISIRGSRGSTGPQEETTVPLTPPVKTVREAPSVVVDESGQTVDSSSVTLQEAGGDTLGSIPDGITVRVQTMGGAKTYREKEPIRLRIRVDTDAHVAVFCLQSDGQMVQLFPNAWNMDTFVKAEADVEIPGTDKSGFEIVAGPPFGTDVIQVVACTRSSLLHEFAAQRAERKDNPYPAVSRGMVVEQLQAAVGESKSSNATPVKWGTARLPVKVKPAR